LAEKRPVLKPAGIDIVEALDLVTFAEETPEGARLRQEEKVVVFFDICSSSTIVDHVILAGKQLAYRNLLIKLRGFLQEQEEKKLCQVYKFIGDGWVLLFRPDVDGGRLMNLLVELSKRYDKWLNELVKPELNPTPRVLGLTFGIDHGKLISLTMNYQAEYIGRPLNIAARLQSKVKDVDKSPAYKALVSKRTYAQRKIPSSFPAKEFPVDLRNIQSKFECFKVTIWNQKD